MPSSYSVRCLKGVFVDVLEVSIDSTDEVVDMSVKDDSSLRTMGNIAKSEGKRLPVGDEEEDEAVGRVVAPTDPLSSIIVMEFAGKEDDGGMQLLLLLLLSIIIVIIPPTIAVWLFENGEVELLLLLVFPIKLVSFSAMRSARLSDLAACAYCRFSM